MNLLQSGNNDNYKQEPLLHWGRLQASLCAKTRYVKQTNAHLVSQYIFCEGAECTIFNQANYIYRLYEMQAPTTLKMKTFMFYTRKQVSVCKAWTFHDQFRSFLAEIVSVLERSRNSFQMIKTYLYRRTKSFLTLWQYTTSLNRPYFLTHLYSLELLIIPL